MACERYEVLLVDAQGQAKQKREWTGAQLLSSVPWLKRMNARGHDVLIHPKDESPLLLLDGLGKPDIAKLERNGVPCCAKIQVEADRFQVWLHLGTAAVSVNLRDGIAKNLGLAQPYGAKFGALAGFVNHQAGEQGGRHLFVLAHAPVKPDAETIAKWGRMLVEAEILARAPGRENPNGRSRGFSR